MSKLSLKAFLALLLVCLLLPPGMVKAQTAAPSGPVYIVQEGDSLWDIAYRFHVSVTELENANGILNANQISAGQPLIIPGLEGIQGVLTSEKVSYGETLASLSQRYNLPINTLQRLNHLTSPNEMYAGYWLVTLANSAPTALGKRATLAPGQSLLELAVLNGTDSWRIMASNRIDNSAMVLPGDVIRLPGQGDEGPGGLPSEISSVDISGLIQGQTAEVSLSGSQGASLQGTFMDHPLNFFSTPGTGYTALQGVHAMAEPGLYPLNVTGSLADGTGFDFTQDVLVSAGDFLYDIPLSVDPATLDPAVTMPEDKIWHDTSSLISPEKMWQGEFSLPVEPVFAECYASRFGSRRSYNGSEYSYYHTGLDYCGQIGDPVYAAAPGVVVFAGPLTVRGNATMIDHGMGVFSAYLHQSEILVKVGEHVEQGQLIGKVGNTGRVEGPHLHFEVLVGSVPVDPLEWLNQEFP